MKQSILIVDDRTSNRDYLSALLSAQGYEILEATDGAEALEIVKVRRPHLVIADILMPRMDGYQFVRQLRREPDVNDIAVIFISGQYPESEARSLAERCGVAEIIFKPAEPQTILDAVSRTLQEPAGSEVVAQTQSDSFENLHRRLLTDTLAKKADELEATNKRLAALIDLGRRLAAERNPARLLSEFCHSAGRICGADFSIVIVTDDVGDEIRHLVANGAQPELVKRITRKPVVAALFRRLGARRHPTILRLSGQSEVDGLPDEFTPLGAILSARVATATSSYGLICFGGAALDHKSDDSLERLAESMGAVLGIAYENALRYGEIEQHAERLQTEVAERARTQKHIEDLNAQLERRVAERTAQLETSHQQLRLSERMASMGTLCAGLGHDMGNILLPMQARLDALEKEKSDDALEQHLAAIRQCVGYLQSLTNGLRTLSLTSTSAADGDTTDLAVWRQEIKPLLVSALPRSVKLHLKIPDDLPQPRISCNHLSQAIFNIVSNAADALREKGAGNVTIEASAVSPESVQFRIIDDGPGMTEDVRSRILDPFFTTKRRAFSTGLGMSLVHGIVKGAGGSIDVRSAPGAGATVTIVLPAKVKSDEDEGLEGTKPAAAVLMADQRLRSFVEVLLVSLGYRTVEGDPGPDGASICVLEACADSLKVARAYLRSNPDGRLAVTGDIDEEWLHLGAFHLGDRERPSEIRKNLRAFALSHHHAEVPA